MWLLLANLAIAAPVDVVLVDGTLPADADTRGRWSADVHLESGAPGHMDLLLPRGPDVRDGTTTAELALGPSPHVTVLVRAHVLDDPQQDLEGTSAVGLTLLRSSVRWDRWDGGVTLPLSRPVRVPGLGGKRVSVQIEADGSTLLAVVRDAGGTVLARTRVRDTGSGSGRAGLRVHDDTTTRLLRLVVQGEAVAEPVHGDPDAPLGVERFVLLPADQRALVPANLSRTILGPWPYDDRGHLGLLLPDAAALDRLVAAGATPEVRPLVPFWAWDADVRAAARSVPITDAGPDLSASYKDPEMVEAVLRDWAARYPDLTELRVLGHTHRGRHVLALRITDHPRTDEDEPTVLLTGATHGSELLSTEYALDAAERLLKGYGVDPAWTRRVDELDVWVVPLVNPDGNAIVHEVTRFGGRKNGRDTRPDDRVGPWEGVDLNRNFPLGFGRDERASRSFTSSAYYRGPEPFSEPESRYLRDLAERRRFAASISFHTNGSMLLVPYTLNDVAQPSPDAAWTVAKAITADVPVQPSGKPLRVRRQLYPVDGTDQDWFRHAYGTLAFLVEGSHHNPEVRATRLASVAALRPLVPALLDRVLDGPRVWGHVTDADGHPVQAAITVSAEALNAGEVWTSRPADGRYDRMLGAGGEVTVTATVDGRAPVFRTVRVQGPTRVDLVLPSP